MVTYISMKVRLALCIRFSSIKGKHVIGDIFCGCNSNQTIITNLFTGYNQIILVQHEILLNLEKFKFHKNIIIPSVNDQFGFQEPGFFIFSQYLLNSKHIQAAYIMMIISFLATLNLLKNEVFL